MRQYDNACRYIIPNPTIGNIIVLILEGARWNASTGHQTLIVYQNLGWSINRNSEHYELVAHFRGQLCASFLIHQI